MVTINSILKEQLLQSGYFIDNEYFDKYVDLLANNFDTPRSKLTQSHHMTPKHYYIHNGLDINNTKDNRVNLIFSDHIRAHYYLSLCAAHDDDRLSNEAALIRMVGRKDISDMNLAEYDKLYNEYQDFNRSVHLGKHHDTSDETKEKISTANKGKYLGHIHIYKDNIEKHIPESELDKYLEDGWKVGRPESVKNNLSKNYNYSSKGMLGKAQSAYQKQKVSNALKGKSKSEEARAKMRASKAGKRLMSNDDLHKAIYVNPDDINDYIENGYHFGRLNK